MAVIQDRHSRAPVSQDAVAQETSAPWQGNGSGLDRLIGLSGAPFEWSLIVVRIALAAAVLVLALVSSGMESVRLLWSTVLIVVALYSGTIAFLLGGREVRKAAALGITADLALGITVFPAVYYFASRNDPGNLSFAAQPAVALVTATVMLATMRLRVWPAVLAGVLVIVAPASLARIFILDGTPVTGTAGDMFTFAAAAMVFTVVGQVIQRTRSDLEWQVANTRRLYSESETRARNQELLAELGRIVSQSPDVRETYDRFAQTVQTMMPADRISVNVFEPERNVLVTTYIAGLGIPGWEENASHALSETNLRAVIDERRPVILGTASHDPSGSGPVIGGEEVGLRSAVIVPLFHLGALIGTLGLWSAKPGTFHKNSAALLEKIGAQIAPAVANARHYSALASDVRERSVFAEISRVLSASPDIADVYDNFVEQVGKLIRWDRISINTVDPDYGQLKTAFVAGVPVPGHPTGSPRPPGNRSVVEHVARHGETIRVDDIKLIVERFPDTDVAVRAGLRSGIYVPLLSDGVVIGTLAAGVTEPGAYSSGDLELLERIAAQIAGTVANSELKARTDRQAREQSGLAEIGRIMTSSVKIDEVYGQFAEEVRSLIPADRVSIIEIDLAAGERTLQHVSGMAIAGTDTRARQPLSKNGVLEAVIRTGEGFAIPNLGEQIDDFPGSQTVYDAGVRSALYAPLRFRGEIIGILGVASREIEVHNEYHFELLQRISAQISGALANARLHEMADRQAKEEAVLAEIGRIVNSSLDIETVYERFAEQVGRILNFDRIAAARLGPGEGEYTIAHVTGSEIQGLEVGTVWKLDETPFGPILRDGETMLVRDGQGSDADDFGRGMALSDAAGIRSSLVVPLIHQDEPIGFLGIRSKSENAFNERDAELARRISALVSSAIANSELLARSNRQAEEEATLGEIGRIITASARIEDVYGRFSDHLRKLIPADRVSVIGIEPKTGEMSIRYASEFPEAAPNLRKSDNFQPNGLMKLVARSGESVWIPDLEPRVTENENVRFVYDSGIRSLLYTPLRSQSTVIGLLCVVSTEPGAHDQTHASLIERISAQIAGALANVRLHEQSAQQAAEESVLGEIGRIVNSSLDVEAIYDQFAEQVRKILPSDRLAIALREPDGTHFKIAHVAGVPVTGLSAGTVRKIADTNLVSLFEDNQTLVQKGDDEAERIHLVPGRVEGLVSSIVVPLVSRDKVIGFIAIRSLKEKDYSEEQTVLFERVATLVSTAISNSDLFERAESEAKERAALAEIGRIVGSSLEIDTVYERFAEQVRKLIEFDRISISYLDRARSTAVSAWAEGDVQTGFGIGREIPIRAFIGTRLGQLVRRRRGAVLDEAEINQFFDQLPWENESSARSMICAPLISDGRTFAGLAVSSVEPNAYGERELEIVTRVGAQVAGAVENARLHGALQRASDELQDINKQKTELMTTVAHELRSPLTAFNAFMDLVLDGTAGDVPEKQLDLLLKASRLSVRMQNILDVFSHLEMAEDQTVPLTVTMFDIEILIANALDLLQPAARHGRIEVQFEPSGSLPTVEGDRQAIDQVISNLVSNAIKYSHEEGVVSIECTAREDEVIVSVTDTGFGISAEDQARLFERFYRGSDPSKLQIRGTGLGLYVSKGLIERHHGRLWCRSESGRGSEFSFALPFEQPAEEPVAGDLPSPESPNRA